jgi:hypothetical protein
LDKLNLQDFQTRILSKDPQSLADRDDDLNILSKSKQMFLSAGPHDCKLIYFWSCIGQQNIRNFPIDG